MPIPLIITSIVLAIFWLLLLIFIIVKCCTFAKSCVYAVKGKQVVVRITMRRGAELYVDGMLEEQFSSVGARRLTLRTMIDGEEFKAHIMLRMFGAEIEAMYNGTALIPDSVGK